MNNIYYLPENYGLKQIGLIEKEPDYDFDMLAVWQHEDGDVLIAAARELAARQIDVNADNFTRVCICGHDCGSHNDITKRCCFKVMLGWDRKIDLPAMRTCNLCPPSGFQERIPNDSFANVWPKDEQIHHDEMFGLDTKAEARRIAEAIMEAGYVSNPYSWGGTHVIASELQRIIGGK